MTPELWIAQGCHGAEELTESRVQTCKAARAQLRMQRPDAADYEDSGESGDYEVGEDMGHRTA